MEEQILEVKHNKILTKEMRKLLKENVGTICKWCEAKGNDSLVVYDINIFRKVIKNVKPWESFHLSECTRCGHSIKFL